MVSHFEVWALTGLTRVRDIVVDTLCYMNCSRTHSHTDNTSQHVFLSPPMAGHPWCARAVAEWILALHALCTAIGDHFIHRSVVRSFVRSIL